MALLFESVAPLSQNPCQEVVAATEVDLDLSVRQEVLEAQARKTTDIDSSTAVPMPVRCRLRRRGCLPLKTSPAPHRSGRVLHRAAGKTQTHMAS